MKILGYSVYHDSLQETVECGFAIVCFCLTWVPIMALLSVCHWAGELKKKL
jgi:hypothetical protein